jgi:polygalacturonase
MKTNHRITPWMALLVLSITQVTVISAAPLLPNINTNNIITITDAAYGAVGDGVITNTVAISNAIVAAAAGGNTNGLLGGTVRIPAPGVYLSGPFPLKNNVNLQIDSNAVLRLLPYDQYPGGIVSPPNFISGTSLTNIALTGGGAIDGQGSPWWPGYKTNNRPVIIYLSKCSRVLFQNITISNPPMQHIAVKGNNAGNVTFLGITLKAPSSSDPTNPSHNTDGVDFAETNGLFQDCVMDTGDDNIAFGSSAGLTRDILVTSCTNFAGHGISIGSYTSSGVSNITVINTTFSGTDNGIRLKSQRDRGGLVQNLNYFNLTMTNVDWPFLIYSYYEFGLGTISVANSAYAANVAATDTVTGVTTTTPIWRNITFSNITAYANNSRPALMIWGLPQMAVSNVVFKNVTLSSTRTAEIFNARGILFINTPLNLPATTNGFDLYNAEIIISNGVPPNTLSLFNGITTNGYGNSLAFYNARASLKNTNVFDDGPLTLADSILTISNNFMLFPSTVLNFTLDASTNRVVVVSNLTLGGTINLATNSSGFGAGTNILLTYAGTLSGNLPTLGSKPAGYNYSFDTNTAGQVNLVVTLPAPSAPTNFTAAGTNLSINLKWDAVSGATYNLKRGTANGGPYPTVFIGLTATNYSDAAVTNAVTYYYVVTAVAGGESTNSLQASAAPLPSLTPTNIILQASSGQLQLSWPQDHLGWRLQIQTNDLSKGLGTNWVTVPNSTNVCQTNVTINPTNGSVFLRLVYP